MSINISVTPLMRQKALKCDEVGSMNAIVTVIV